MRQDMVVMSRVMVVVLGFALVFSACLSDPNQTGFSTHAVSCASDGTCVSGETCVSDYCMPECETNDLCPAGDCIDGICEFEPIDWECTSADECPEDAECVDGFCQALSTCDPAPEVCNGIDDDCDGLADEDFDLAGDPANCGACGMVCDDGNPETIDRCTDGTCFFEPIVALCGNGIVEAGEECDDGNAVSGDGCENDCTFTEAWPACGNGIVEAGEECDDGNAVSGDGCENDCTFTGGCVPSPELCNGIDDDCDGIADEDFDLTSDPNNCAACGIMCDDSELCIDGVCSSI